ncbi:cytochrome P450 [Phanerochaete sordida]|uniref:Cytochrome P450 n=1 Tax=Phanerochaete sordida TaxID=48140 RepID=A0A9P3GNW7_9APHY|nr:cytochrome P450 [Phanerochaete sordida]
MAIFSVPVLCATLGAALFLLLHLIRRLACVFHMVHQQYHLLGTFSMLRPRTSGWRSRNGVDSTILGAHFFVLNSTKAVSDLLEKRSNKYSDRPVMPMLKMTGWDRNWAAMAYGDYWRLHRKLFHQYFRAAVVPTYHASSRRAVEGLLQALRNKPDQFKHHIRFMAGTNILRIMYGMEVDSDHDPKLGIVEESVEILSKIAATSAYLVNSFPLLEHVPSWFPGAQFKRDAAKWKPLVDEMFLGPYREARSSIDHGSPRACVLTDMISHVSRNAEGYDSLTLENTVINIAGTAYAGTSEQIQDALDHSILTPRGLSRSVRYLTLLTFVLAMLMYPEVQRTAHQQLDDVVGRDRLPEMEDRDALPFITAVVKECLRWRPPLPLVAHSSLEDDKYREFDIPAGYYVIGNAWAILHDPKRYSDPDTFNPFRFLDSEGRLRDDVLDPTEAFGHGRRICPGRFFALDSVWLAASNILAAFSIEEAVDGLRNPIKPTGEYLAGAISFPAPFEAAFQVRGPDVDLLLR